MIDKNIRRALEATARIGGIAPERIARMVEVLDGDLKPRQSESPPVLMTQAEKARQLGVSRFTVRKLVEAGKLHPVELLPGLLRYPAAELVGEA